MTRALRTFNDVLPRGGKPTDEEKLQVLDLLKAIDLPGHQQLGSWQRVVAHKHLVLTSVEPTESPNLESALWQAISRGPLQETKVVLHSHSGTQTLMVDVISGDFNYSTYYKMLDMQQLVTDPEKDWDATNRRRVSLIRKQLQEGLSVNEEAELVELQNAIDRHVDEVAPLSFDVLEAFEERARRLGMPLP